MYNHINDFLSKFIKKEVKISTELITACEYLELPKNTSEKVVKSTTIITIISAIICLIILLSNEITLVNTGILLTIPLLINHFYSNYYKDKYYEQRVKDLGSLPDFFTQLITNLKINSNLENALINSTKFNHGKITKKVKKLINNLNTGKEWDVKKNLLIIMKSFKNNSVNSAINTLISSLSIRNKNKRNSLLNNSLNHLLKGIVEETKSFSRKIYTPILLLFSLGTIIPLIIISIMPLMGLLNSTTFDTNSIILFFASSILVIKIIINNLKKKSPSRFSQIIIKKEEKGINKFLLLILLIGISSPTIIHFFSNYLGFKLIILENYQSLFFYLGLSIVISIYLYSKTKNLIKEKQNAQLLENELINSFYLLASKINEGHSVESSLKYVSETVNPGQAKIFLKNAYHKINNLGLSIQTAFSKSHLMKNVYSQRVKSLVELFITSVKKHSISASENIIELCNYYNKIISAEKEMINSMNKNIDMIRLTTYLFSPIVCALIINIQRLISSIMISGEVAFLSISFNNINLELIQFIISIYVLFLTIILSELYSFLTTNNEKISSQYELFKSISVSAIIFTTTLIMSRILLFQL